MILITAPGVYTGEELEPGRYYNVEPAFDGTSAQNRAFHALLSEYWRSGCHSYAAGSFDQFKDFIKRDLGAGFDSYVCIIRREHGYSWAEYKSREEIDQDIVARDSDGRPMIRGKLKSWSDYTKSQRRNTIDNLIAEMHQAGVNTKKFHEILQGMEGLWK